MTANNIFGTPTVADLIQHFSDKTDMPLQRQKDICSALRVICDCLHKAPTQVAAVPGPLVRMVKEINPGLTALKPRRWKNILSLLKVALAEAGPDVFAGRSTVPLSPDCQALWELLADKGHWRFALSRFFRFLSANGYVLDQVGDVMIERFRQSLEEAGIFKDTNKTVRETIYVWNRAHRHIVGWPDIALTVPYRRDCYTMPWNKFPESLQRDVSAYFASRKSEDASSLFVGISEEENVTARRKQPDRTEFQIRQFFSALVHQGVPLESLTSLNVLADIDMFRTGLRFFVKRATMKKKLIVSATDPKAKTTRQIHQIACKVRTVCRTWAKLESQELRDTVMAAVNGICKQLDPGNSTMTEKNRTLLKQFDNPETKTALIALPAELMADAENLRLTNPRGAAYLAQRALAIELFLMTRMREADIADLRPEQHFTWSTVGKEKHVQINKLALKNSYPLQYDLHPRTIAILETYLKNHRDVIFSGKTLWLFPTSSGAPHNPCSFGQVLRKLIGKRIGIRMHMHLFRHFVAVEHLKKNPGEYHVIARALGHRNVNTAMRYYTGPEVAHTLRHVDESVLGKSTTSSRPSPSKE
ncbi:hypothetical protein CU669_19605 [Paramagnetospirillum kuznetsovii]|uniref:Tyr recombinase domain-containing protein n=1 Tax=Paramagnetospirillum kuznetsovii TaxID=2053833 RepID=A0A364NSY3_9PROT|nr:site-specific integrase [Paramagnetospirillum kuznetsovii]RAU20193.1 hypothetical protein CU669_19605 [Paramagnetospirillum kuznetsovii]